MPGSRIRSLLLAGGALAALSACSTVVGGSGRMIADGQPFSMAPGARVMLADRSQLRYLRLVADSRCPPGVQCIRAGDAEVALQWTAPGGALQEFSLKTPAPAQAQARDLGARRLTLVALARGDAPRAQLRIDAID